VAIVARLLASETLAGIALTASVLIGFGLGGFVAGKLAPVNGRFHGSITALVVAGIVVAVASLGGSPSPLGSVLLLALIAIVTGGMGGAIGGRGSNEPPTSND
jgi:putative membrane protein (TIGR04086 family)